MSLSSHESLTSLIQKAVTLVVENARQLGIAVAISVLGATLFSIIALYIVVTIFDFNVSAYITFIGQILTPKDGGTDIMDATVRPAILTLLLLFIVSSSIYQALLNLFLVDILYLKTYSTHTVEEIFQKLIQKKSFKLLFGIALRDLIIMPLQASKIGLILLVPFVFFENIMIIRDTSIIRAFFNSILMVKDRLVKVIIILLSAHLIVRVVAIPFVMSGNLPMLALFLAFALAFNVLVKSVMLLLYLDIETDR